VKNGDPEDLDLVIPRGDLFYWKFIELLKFQKTNPKKTIAFNRLGIYL